MFIKSFQNYYMAFKVKTYCLRPDGAASLSSQFIFSVHADIIGFRIIIFLDAAQNKKKKKTDFLSHNLMR